MKRIKVSEATEIQLDWLVAKCEHQFWRKEVVIVAGGVMRMPTSKFHTPRWLNYSTDWAQGGALIERERITLDLYESGEWLAQIWGDDIADSDFDECGPTPLIAVCRCYVASKLGDVVEVPDELVQ